MAWYRRPPSAQIAASTLFWSFGRSCSIPSSKQHPSEAGDQVIAPRQIRFTHLVLSASCPEDSEDLSLVAKTGQPLSIRFLITHLAQPPWIRYKPRTNKGFGRRDADG